VSARLDGIRRGFIFHTSRLVRFTTLYAVYAAIFVQNRVFCLPHLHLTPPLGGFPSEYCHPVWHGKTRMAWLPDGEKNSKISLLVLAQLANVTDRQTPHAGNSCAYAYHRTAKISPSGYGSHTALVFRTKRHGNIPTGTPHRVVEYRWGRLRSRFSTNIWLCGR